MSGLYHDSAAALIRDGVVVAAVQEERFSRIKNDPAFPVRSIEWCLNEAGVDRGGLGAVAYYDKPITTFSRILTSYAAAGPRGLRTFTRVIPEWFGRKLWVGYEVEKTLRTLGHEMPGELIYAEHHMSHAAAAFYPSPFERAAILTFDGVGEWATSSIGIGHGRRVELLSELRFPDSLGLLYSAFTAHAGFRVNSGEYKLMGLAPFGEPTFRDKILDELINIHDDGSFELNLRHFDFLAGRKMTNRHFDRLVGGPARRPDAPITQRDGDLARSIQEVVEEVVLRMARHAHDLTDETDAVLAGGVALNCVANGRLLREGPFDRIWVQPAAGDAGSALGCALWAWHEVLEHDRVPATPDGMSGGQLGPSFSAVEIAAALDAAVRPYERLADPDDRARRIAELVDTGNIVGLFQGRMEFGPRALGNRSIIADPRSSTTQAVLNDKIKRRESFRPFAPAVLAEHAAAWFDLDVESPYMLFVAPVAEAQLVPVAEGSPADDDITVRVQQVRSTIPAVTHVDGSARVQTVGADRSPEFHRILTAFHAATGCPILVNTSFNVRGEPIVCTPEDAYRCFMTTDMDWLVLEDCLLDRRAQPPFTADPADVAAD